MDTSQPLRMFSSFMVANTTPITTALHPQQDRFLRLPDVAFLTGLRRSSIYALSKAGTFPKAVHLTGYSVAWRKSELEAWMAERLTLRDSTALLFDAPEQLPQPAPAAAAHAANTRRRAQAASHAVAPCESPRPARGKKGSGAAAVSAAATATKRAARKTTTRAAA